MRAKFDETLRLCERRTLFILMEYCEGIREAIDAGELSEPDDALVLFRQLLDALNFVHSRALFTEISNRRTSCSETGAFALGTSVLLSLVEGLISTRTTSRLERLFD